MTEKVTRLELPGLVENPLATWKRKFRIEHDPFTPIRRIFGSPDYERRVDDRRAAEFHAHATEEQKRLVRYAERRILEADRKLAEAEQLGVLTAQAAVFSALTLIVSVAILCLV